MVYTSEKTLKDLGDKVAADLKHQTEEAVNHLRQVMAGEDIDAIRKGTDSLGEIIQKIGSSAYSADGATPQQPGEQPDGGPQGGNPGGEDVVDGEFKQV